MHPELMRIVVDAMQSGEIGTTPETMVPMFALFAIITLAHGILLGKVINWRK